MMNATTKEKIFDLILADGLKESLKKILKRLTSLQRQKLMSFRQSLKGK